MIIGEGQWWNHTYLRIITVVPNCWRTNNKRILDMKSVQNIWFVLFDSMNLIEEVCQEHMMLPYSTWCVNTPSSRFNHSLTSITLGHKSLGKSNNKLIPHHITLRNQRCCHLGYACLNVKCFSQQCFVFFLSFFERFVQLKAALIYKHKVL